MILNIKKGQIKGTRCDLFPTDKWGDPLTTNRKCVNKPHKQIPDLQIKVRTPIPGFYNMTLVQNECLTTRITRISKMMRTNTLQSNINR